MPSLCFRYDFAMPLLLKHANSRGKTMAVWWKYER